LDCSGLILFVFCLLLLFCFLLLFALFFFCIFFQHRNIINWLLPNVTWTIFLKEAPQYENPRCLNTT
jgi:hypothetical protein